MSATYSVYLPNYSVGPDCYEAIPSVTARYGKKVVIIGGKTALSKAQDAILAAVKGHLDVTAVLWYGGNSTYENVDMLMNTKEVQEADMVFAVGGGRAVDLLQKPWRTKWANPFSLSRPLLPTALPAPAICVMYKQDGSLAGYYYPKHLRRTYFYQYQNYCRSHRKNFCGPALAMHSAKNARF